MLNTEFATYYVVCDFRRDDNYYFCKDSSTWLKGDFINCTHYKTIESIPEFSIKVHIMKLYLILEYVK